MLRPKAVGSDRNNKRITQWTQSAEMNSLLWVSGSSLETGCRAQPEELEEVIQAFL